MFSEEARDWSSFTAKLLFWGIGGGDLAPRVPGGAKAGAPTQGHSVQGDPLGNESCSGGHLSLNAPSSSGCSGFKGNQINCTYLAF